MSERLIDRYVLQLICGFTEERAAGRSQQDFFESLLLRCSLQALEDRAVLAVYGQQLHSVFLNGAHDKLAAGYQSFFIREGYILLSLDRFKRRSQADHADHGVHENIRGVAAYLEHTVHAAEYLG